MKIVKLISFLLLLSSCNKYLGTVESNYTPKNDVEEIFTNKEIILDNNTELVTGGEVLYPINKKFNFENSLNFQKITSIDKKSNFLFLKNEIYYNKKNHIHSLNKNDYKEKNSIKIELDKDEAIILIYALEQNIFVLTNRGKIFKSLQDSFELVSNLQTFLSQNTISNSSKIIAFSVFGEVIEIDLKNNTSINTGNFIINHGITKLSNVYTYGNNNVLLFNSGTLIFLNQLDNSPEIKYFLEDLNILSEVGIFEDFIETPFNIDGFLYFIEKKGLISVFDPVTSEILWETDISSPIVDYFIDDKKNLFLLTFNRIYIFSSQGNLLKEISHNQKNPFNFWTDSKYLYLANQGGISIIDFNGELINSIKQKFTDFLKFFENNNQYYFVDSKNLYILSE